MPLPSPLETVTVRGSWFSPVTGDPLIASATLRAVTEARSAAGDVLLTTIAEPRLLVDGAAEWVGVLFSDSAGLSNPLVYQVEVAGAGYSRKRLVSLNKADAVAGVIQLADIDTVAAVPDFAAFVPLFTVGQIGGPAGPLNEDGEVPAAQLPAGGGGGAVASVDGRTGVVVLGDLYTDPAELAAGLATRANTVHTHTAVQVTDFTATVDARVQLVVDAAPAALDTLNELAAALGDDANFAATMTTALAGKQSLDTDLSAIAALSPADGSVIARVAGAWSSRTAAQLKVDLGLAAADVGLGNVANLAPANLPVSTAAQAALDLKAPLANPAFTGTPTGITKAHIGLGDVANLAPADLPVSAATQAVLDTKAPRVQITDPMTKYGIVAATGRFHEFMGTGGFTDQFVVARCFIPAGQSFSRMVIPIRSSGSFTPGSGKPNQLAWWNDAGQLQQVTPDDDAMWTVADWYVASLPAGNAGQVVDRYVYAGFQKSGFTGGGQYVLTEASDSGGIPFSHAPGSAQRFCAYAGALVALGDFNPSAVGTLTSFMPFIGFME
jgi:hypothetical protein